MITVSRDDLNSAFNHLSEIASLHYKKNPEECFEAIKPSLANPDAASAVVFVMMIVWIETTCLHPDPC